jgi:hypothetical protein
MEVLMKVGTRIGLALAAVLVLTAIAAVPASAGTASKPAVSKASACSLSTSEINGGLGASYVYELKVSNLDCGKAKKLVQKFHACRHDNGGADGHCSSVKGYSCNEKKIDSSPQLLQAKATCKKGSKKFKQTFGESL